MKLAAWLPLLLVIPLLAGCGSSVPIRPLPPPTSGPFSHLRSCTQYRKHGHWVHYNGSAARHTKRGQCFRPGSR